MSTNNNEVFETWKQTKEAPAAHAQLFTALEKIGHKLPAVENDFTENVMSLVMREAASQNKFYNKYRWFLIGMGIVALTHLGCFLTGQPVVLLLLSRFYLTVAVFCLLFTNFSDKYHFVSGLLLALLCSRGFDSLIPLSSSSLPVVHPQAGHHITYGRTRVVERTNSILLYLEGSFGALAMLASGIAAILTSTLGRYRASAGFLTIAIGCFITRSMMSTFYNDTYIAGDRTIRYNDARVLDSAGIYFRPNNSDSKDHYSAERYGRVEEQVRTAVKDEAFSTFAADVDTASYSNIRRYLSRGILPPPEGVRVEECVNYFPYEMHAPQNDVLGATYEIARSPFDSDRYLLKLAVNSAVSRDSLEKGWNLVFLIDVSGSMSERSKLPLVKESLRLLVDRMRPQDRVAIVTYAGYTSTSPSFTGMDKVSLLETIGRLGAGGSTNGSGGIEAAYRVAAQNYINGAVNRVILATDGDFNVGATSTQDLLSLIEKKRETGVTLTTLGFGEGNLNEEMMEQLADHGNGNFFYIDSYMEARKVLDQELQSNMEVVAKDVKLQVDFNSAQVKEYRLIGYDNRKLEKKDFNDDTKDGGEIGSGHKVTAFYELNLTDATSAGNGLESEIGTLRIRFKQPEGSKSKLIELPLKKDKIMDFNQTSTDFQFAAAVAHFAQILKRSQYTSTYSLEQVRAIAEAARGEDRFGLRSEFIRLVDTAIQLEKR